MANLAETDYNFDTEFEEHFRRIFYSKQFGTPSKYDPSTIEHFGVLSLNDLQAPERKLWVIYYCKQSEIDDTVDRIFQKYGKKNMYEIFRKPIYSGAALRSKVKTSFSNLRWHVKGNLLEAPPQSHFNDERVVKAITDIYNEDRKMIYNYIIAKHDSYIKYNK